MSFTPTEFDTKSKIVNRFMELFDTADEIKKLFNSLLPEKIVT